MLWEKRRATRSVDCSLYLLLVMSYSTRDKVTGEQKFIPFSLFPSINVKSYMLQGD